METLKKQSRTVEEEMRRERKFWKQNQLWTLLLAGAVILFGILSGSGQSVAPGARELLLTMHDGSTQVVEYDAITQAELLDNADYGTLENGKETRTGKSGTWEHPEWGSYTLCTYDSCDQAVRITTTTHSYVVNLPSVEETQQLFRLIQDKIPASK